MKRSTRAFIAAVLVPAFVAGCSFGELFEGKKIDYNSAPELDSALGKLPC